MAENTLPGNNVMTIDARIAEKIKQDLGQNVYLCYQCVKCTGGCPVAEFVDWQPNQIMRALQLGQEDIALKSDTPWLCASCQTCTTRCPQGLDITAIMEYLTRESVARGIKPQVKEVDSFNKAFLREVKIWGRSYELGLMAEMKLRTGKFTEDLDLGFKVIRKNKLPILPEFVRPPRKVKPLPATQNTVGYYPGCSLHSTAKEYDQSTRAVCDVLDIRLAEPKGWVCCGSTPAHRSDPELALRLPMENLRLIEQSGLEEVVMPCAACFSRHKFAQHEIRHDTDRKSRADEMTGYHYQDSVKISSLADAIFTHSGAEGIRARVKKPLDGVRVVAYYGCLLSRPPEVTGTPHPENPMELDNILKALGADVIDWSYKTTCCGATHSLTRQDIVLELSSRLIKHAQAAGAEAIAVACPLCHTNLDARQFQMGLADPMPVLFFTQLMSVAFGKPEKAALDKNLVDPRPYLASKGKL